MIDFCIIESNLRMLKSRYELYEKALKDIAKVCDCLLNDRHESWEHCPCCIAVMALNGHDIDVIRNIQGSSQK